MNSRGKESIKLRSGRILWCISLKWVGFWFSLRITLLVGDGSRLYLLLH